MTIVKLKLKMVDQCQPWFTTFSGTCQHKQRCNTLTMWHPAFTNNYVTIWCLSSITLQLPFIKGYVTLWPWPMLTSHCDNPKMWCSLSLMLDYDIHRRLFWIVEVVHGTLHNVFLTLKHSSRLIFDFNIHPYYIQ